MARPSVWTEEEDQVIRDKYPRYGQCCLEHLPGKTKSQLANRVYQLGVKLEGYSAGARSRLNSIEKKIINHKAYNEPEEIFNGQH